MTTYTSLADAAEAAIKVSREQVSGYVGLFKDPRSNSFVIAASADKVLMSYDFVAQFINGDLAE